VNELLNIFVKLYIAIIVLLALKHSEAQKATGNKSGGYRRCSMCSISFKKSNVDEIFHYVPLLQATRKGLQDQVSFVYLSKSILIHFKLKLFSQPNASAQAASYGLKSPSPLLGKDFITPLEQRRLHEYQQCSIDNLHNLKGSS
jgi:hypothetical protein